jgi:hypothetical protein
MVDLKTIEKWDKEATIQKENKIKRKAKIRRKKYGSK